LNRALAGIKKIFLFSVLTCLFCVLLISSCGYDFSPSPYQLKLPEGGMSLYVPVAINHSHFQRLGPDLTRAFIDSISGIKGLRLRGPGSDATLKLEISNVVVKTGSWEPPRTAGSEIPEISSSRTAFVEVIAEFTRPGEGENSPPVVRQSSFSSYRTYAVSLNQDQVDMQEAEALKWILNDISRKIASLMFREF
jgi:hypothetical protein